MVEDAGIKMKKLYIVNLNKTRIFILTGIFLIIMGIFFAAGARYNHFNSQKNHVEIPIGDTTSANLSQSGGIGKDELIMENPVTHLDPVLPEEDQKLFGENKVIIENDPFILDLHNNLSSSTDDSIEEKKSKNLNASHLPENKISKPSKKSNKFLTENRSIEKYYTLQLGAYKHEKDAQKFKKRLEALGIESRVDQGILYYFVRSGKSKTEKGLDPQIQKIKENKLEALIVSLSNK